MAPRPRPLLIAAALLAVSGAALALATVAARPRQRVAASTAAATTKPLMVRTVQPSAGATTGLLDGMPMREADYQSRAKDLPVAVMVDNWVDARPQIGLDRAEVVYEALVESDITRFMAVYWRNDAPVIEPVRSARTQYLGMVSELNATYAHVGSAADDGPADAEAQMHAWGIHSVDEGEGQTAIQRDPAREAPHNAYTSTDALRATARANGWTGPAAFTPWPFKDDGGTAGSPVVEARMDFDTQRMQNGAFAVRWTYDPASNGYRRFQAGAPHVDGRTGAQLTAKNVILQFEDVRPAGDRSGHVLYRNEGSGRAIVLLDGRAVDATWQKDGRTGRTRYLDASGREIPLNRGATWVEMLPLNAPVSLT